MEDQDTAKKPMYAGFLWPILRGIALIVALCGFVAFLSEFLYGGKWGIGTAVFVLATCALMALTREPEMPSGTEREADERVTQRGFPDWSLISYCLITGLGFNWVCAFLWFSRRYGFFAAPVIGVTGLIFALYASIGLLVAHLTARNWRIALLVFAVAPCALGAIVLRLGLLR